MDGKDIAETAENKASAEALDRARLARERREAEQRKRLDELRAHAAAAQAQREKRDEDRRRRQAEQRARDDDRRQQVEERKRAIWEASVSRREALLQRERERNERLDRSRAARSTQNSCFAFGSSTPRLLEPQDSSSYFWAARSTIPLDEMNFFQSLAASTTNVMFASAPLTRPASALQLNFSDNDSKDESDRPAPLVMWSPVARRRTDLVPTLPVPRAPGRAYSMTRLDKIPTQRPLHSASPSMHHLNRTQTRSGDSSSGSRPESALSNAGGVLRRTSSFPRKPRPASIAGTGVNTPRGGAGGDSAALSAATSPSVSRDSTVMAGGDVPRRPRVPPRPRPLSSHITTRHTSGMSPGDGKPPPHRKLKPASDDKATRGKSRSPGRTLSPSPADSKEPSVDKEINNKIVKPVSDKNQVSAIEVTQKLEALHIQNGDEHPQAPNQNIDKVRKNASETNAEQKVDNEPIEMPKAVEEKPNDAPKNNEKKDKIEESEMTASMSGKRITTEEEAKAALAERRRRAREELEKQAEINRAREELEKEAQAERLRLEEERQRREEEEAKELAQLQRKMEEEKLRKAIEAQQQLEREEAERKAREEIERQARLKEDEEKRKATEEAEKLRKEEAEREEKERLARKQRVEAIMARTRLKKAEEEKNKQENKGQPAQPAVSAAAFPAAPTAQPDNGNTVVADDVPDCGLDASQTEAINTPHEDAPNAVPSTTTESNPVPNNGNVTVDLLGKSEKNNIEPLDLKTYPLDLTTRCQEILDNSTNANVPAPDTNKGNNIQQPSNVGHISANFIQTERMSAAETKIPENVPKLIEDDFTAHNGHGTPHNHPLTLQNAI